MKFATKLNTIMSMMIPFAASLATLSFADNASAGNKFNLKVCGKWRSQYVDGNMGEDVYSSTSELDRAALYAAYEITQAGSPVSSGYLDANGCTPYFEAEDGLQYKIEQKTRFLRTTNRKYYSQPIQNGTGNDPDFADWLLSYVNYYTPSGHSTGQNVTFNKVVGANFHSQVGPVIGQMLGNANALNIPSDTTFHVVGGDDITVGYRGEGNVGLTWVPGGSATTDDKFHLGHELTGHPVGDLKVKAGGARVYLHGSNCGYTDSDQYCQCIGGYDHCIQSKEYIRCAEFEGWAQFIATFLFNHRDEDDGYFGAYRDTLFPASYGVPNNRKNAPWSLDAYDSYKWDEENCDGDSTPNYGTQWDWLTFFWQVYDSGEQINISQLHAIWPTEGAAGSSVYWANIISSANSVLGTNEYLHFEAMGEDNGVDH